MKRILIILAIVLFLIMIYLGAPLISAHVWHIIALVAGIICGLGILVLGYFLYLSWSVCKKGYFDYDD